MSAKKFFMITWLLLGSYNLWAGSFIFGRNDKESNKFEKRLDSLGSEVNALKVEVDSLSIQMDRVIAIFREIKRLEGYGGEMEMQASNPNAFSQVKSVQNQINSLNKRVAELEKSRQELVEKDPSKNNTKTNAEPHFEEKNAKQEQAQTEIKPQKTKSFPQEANKKQSIQAQYQRAVNLHNKGEHKRAIREFNEIIKQDSTDNLADNAQFWIGACYKSMKQYERAIVEFQEVLNFTDSNKKDDALYNMGRSLIAAGKKDQAENVFRKLVNDYPDSEFVNLAIKTMKEL